VCCWNEGGGPPFIGREEGMSHGIFVTPKNFASFKIEEMDLIMYFCGHLT
jgi:hypothetical protein